MASTRSIGESITSLRSWQVSNPKSNSVDDYAVIGDEALALFVKILAHGEFARELQRMGWKGEVYFCSITGPEPGDEMRVEILLDGDFLRDRSEITIPRFQMYEYVGILNHELNHVFQKLD